MKEKYYGKLHNFVVIMRDKILLSDFFKDKCYSHLKSTGEISLNLLQ